MADPLYELLVPSFNKSLSTSVVPNSEDPVTTQYLNRLFTLPLASLTSTEPQSLAQASHSTLLSLQSLSARSNEAIIASSDHLSRLSQTLPLLALEAKSLQNDIPGLDEQAVAFSTKYNRSAENGVLDRRKKALMMARNVDRLSDILDLPTLLSSAISSSTAQGASSTTNYASALDLYSHIKRLHLLYQDSALIHSIYKQTEAAMRQMTLSLIASLRTQNIKLAAAMRTIGWLRRVAPELDSKSSDGSPGNREGALGALFLVCRLTTLVSMLSALDPLRDLADQETAVREREKGTATKASSTWSGGQQTERYLKRYIEIFREQSFAIISMYKSIFPSNPDHDNAEDLGPKFKSLGLKSIHASSHAGPTHPDPLSPPPSSLSTFPLHLIELLIATLKQYLPNVQDKPSRESLLTQVLYCAGSLGRLGADFSLMLAVLEEGDGDGSEEEGGEDSTTGAEWVEVMRKHRVLAGKLEQLASGTGAKEKGLSLNVGA